MQDAGSDVSDGSDDLGMRRIAWICVGLSMDVTVTVKIEP